VEGAMSDHGNFKIAVIACQDGRLGKTNAEWFQKLREGGEVDTILVAGGIQELVFWYDGNLILRFIAWFLGLFGIYVSSVMRGARGFGAATRHQGDLLSATRGLRGSRRKLGFQR